MATFANNSKSSTTFTNNSLGNTSLTIADATFTFDSAIAKSRQIGEVRGELFANNSKNTTTWANNTKN